MTRREWLRLTGLAAVVAGIAAVFGSVGGAVVAWAMCR